MVRWINGDGLCSAGKESDPSSVAGSTWCFGNDSYPTVDCPVARRVGFAALEENFLPLSEVFLPILVLGLVSIGFIAPIVGEFQKRKLTNDILRKKLSVPVAIILNTLFWLLFWPTHAPIVYILFVGLIANVLYFHYKSLWPPIIFSGVMALLEITGGIFMIVDLLG